MKQLAFLLCLVAGYSAHAAYGENYVYSINELYVPSSSTWKLDVSITFVDFWPNDFDSIVVKSNYGTGTYVPKVKKLEDRNTTILLTLTNDSLSHPIEINQSQDKIYTYIYCSNFIDNIDSVSYGYQSSCLPALTATTSFKNTGYADLIVSNKPQIGVVDKSGTTACVIGTLYDKNLNALSGGFIYWSIIGSQYFDNEDGRFTGYIYPFCFRDSIKTIQKFNLDGSGKWYAVKPFLIKAEIGDTVYQDIYILGETTAVAQPTVIGISVYPNPASEVLQVAYEANEDLQLVVSSIAGQEVEQLALPAGQSPLRVPLGAHYQSGMYVACLLHNGAVLQRLRFVVQR